MENNAGCVCGGLNENGTHRLIGNDTIGKCDLVRVHEALLKKCVTGGWFWDFKCSSQA